MLQRILITTAIAALTAAVGAAMLALSAVPNPCPPVCGAGESGSQARIAATFLQAIK